MYTQQIPGITVFTPMTQFGLRNSPSLRGLGDGTNTVDPTAVTPSTVLQTAENLVSNNPLPVLILLGILLLRK